VGLPAPDLDDRSFQNLVDDAKRLVQQRCPEWTDHNVSDPGVTLLEACAQMVDQLIYRLNRVPDRHYVKFLELMGVELHPSSAARGEVTFWLSAPQPQTVLVRAETEVATPRTDVQDPVVLTTVEDLEILSCSRLFAGAQPAGGEAVDVTASLGTDEGFRCFSPTPRPGDALLVGLSQAVPSCAVRLTLDCRVAGVGVDPEKPPLVWEAWSGGSWMPCEVQSDDTGALNKPGSIVLHVPPRHRAHVLAKQRAGWLRCRLLVTEEDEATYTASPVIRDIVAATVGGTVGTVHAESSRDEEIGVSDGTPAQRFRLAHRPVVPWDEPSVLHALSADGVQEWTEVPSFADSGPDDRHFHIDAAAGEVEFGPAVREQSGSVRSYGAVPPRGARLVMAAYHTGGGRRGNVAVGQVRVLKTSVPYVDRVENRAPSVGGADEETLANAMTRGPLLLRNRDRAVTADDFEALAREVAPEAARVHCVPATEPGEAGGVRILVVPHVSGDSVGRVNREDLEPPEGMLSRIARRLEERRLVGTRIVVEPPDYRWVTAVVSLHARARHRPEEVSQDVLRALYRLFHPLNGGSDGTGWPLGRAVQAQEVVAALADIPGVDLAEEIDVQLFPADARTHRREKAVRRLELTQLQLVLSYEHQVQVSA
jgi:predicted phage baseplate assembly protein